MCIPGRWKGARSLCWSLTGLEEVIAQEMLCKEHPGKESSVRKRGGDKGIWRSRSIEILWRTKIQNGKEIEMGKPAEVGRQLDYVEPYKHSEGLFWNNK